MSGVNSAKIGMLALSLAYSLTWFGCATEGEGSEEGLLMMSYNVKSLFDANDDGSEFEGFSVKEGTWSEALYRQRLSLLKTVIEKAGRSVPDIIILLEIENRAVLERIAGLVDGMSGASVAIASAEGNAFACGVISRYPIVSTKAHAVTEDPDSPQRNTLETRIRLGNRDLVLFSCHWKSKLGGAEKTEAQRREAAALLRVRIAKILSEEPDADIIVAGDLNENADESLRIGGSYATALTLLGQAVRDETEILFLTGNSEKWDKASPCPALFSPWLEPGAGNLFSYRYGDARETIDHFLLSPGLFDDTGFRYRGFAVADASFLKDDSGNPKEWNTLSRSGYSDHFPILLELDIAD